MTSLSFQTATQKNEAKLSSFVQFENQILFQNIFTYRVTSQRALFSDNARLARWKLID